MELRPSTIWSAIRAELVKSRGQIEGIANAESAEHESILMDGLARDLADAVVKEIEETC